jgi:hypothetical protein
MTTNLHPVTILHILSAIITIRYASATCYFPNGTANSDPAFQPCNTTTGAQSMCCATNRPGYALDICLTNGLCQNPCNADGDCGAESGGRFWRESCTDPTWNSLYCLKNVCADTQVSFILHYLLMFYEGMRDVSHFRHYI